MLVHGTAPRALDLRLPKELIGRLQILGDVEPAFAAEEIHVAVGPEARNRMGVNWTPLPLEEGVRDDEQ